MSDYPTGDNTSALHLDEEFYTDDDIVFPRWETPRFEWRYADPERHRPAAYGTLAFATNPGFPEWGGQWNDVVQEWHRRLWAIQEIAVIRVVARYPWAWDLIGVTRWAKTRGKR